jgi:hypothetical protein
MDFYEKVYAFGKEHLNHEFGNTHLTLSYLKHITTDETAYETWKTFLRKVKRSTAYQDPKTQQKLTHLLKEIEETLREPYKTDTLHALFVSFLGVCYYIFIDYIPYIPLYHDFLKL